jgi:hypothetical protein
MFCTGRIRHKGMPGGRSEAQPQASIERARTWRKRTLVPHPVRAMRRLRGGFEEQIKRALNDRQRMERDDVIPTQATPHAGAVRLSRFMAQRATV